MKYGFREKLGNMTNVIFQNQYVSLLYLAKLHGNVAVEVCIIVN